jgi:hypothetical protein
VFLSNLRHKHCGRQNDSFSGPPVPGADFGLKHLQQQEEKRIPQYVTSMVLSGAEEQNNAVTELTKKAKDLTKGADAVGSCIF